MTVPPIPVARLAKVDGRASGETAQCAMARTSWESTSRRNQLLVDLSSYGPIAAPNFLAVNLG